MIGGWRPAGIDGFGKKGNAKGKKSKRLKKTNINPKKGASGEKRVISVS